MAGKKLTCDGAATANVDRTAKVNREVEGTIMT